MAAQGLVPLVLVLLNFIFLHSFSNAEVLTPPYFNLAEARRIAATATCGVGVAEKELYCRLTGATSDKEEASRQLLQGQFCDYCDVNDPDLSHPAEFAIDGSERWWQSPPLSRGLEYNQVNLTINLGQEFHVAYVYIRMANSPRPGVWALERSTDFGQTWSPWQFFADSASDCINFFGVPSSSGILRDDSVICTTEFSQVVPLENGEIVVSLVNGRPSAKNFSHSETLQEWTKATNMRLRLIRTKTLLAHLMALTNQDPTVTRRYFYSIKDISVGGRCVCNGHADTCDIRNPENPTQLLCNCQHNTCGDQCEYCCPGFVQKKWKRVTQAALFECEPCQCYGHSNECIYDPDVDAQRRSIDIYGVYEGGGVCQNCADNTEGINCEKCVRGYYRPYGVPRNITDACRRCRCDMRVSTGECEENTGRCLCRPEYTGENCDQCSIGYYGYPSCRPCDCNYNGTEGTVCQVGGGQCPCKPQYSGKNCDMCSFGHYGFPYCYPCNCGAAGSVGTTCNAETGQCQCRNNYGSRDCAACQNGYYGYPICSYCDCDPAGTVAEICDKDGGQCLCGENYAGPRCDRCASGSFNFPYCAQCNCSTPGSLGQVCSDGGQCRCQPNYGGLRCDRCAPGYYRYPQCSPCNCDLYGSYGASCDQVTGQCTCRDHFEELTCNKCMEGFYNYPVCEECNCNPAGAKEVPGYPLGGCGAVSDGRLCECKERVTGRICDSCKAGYWNLDINNPQGCQECQCYAPGTVSSSSVCSVHTGQCICKVAVSGQRCRSCRDGYYNLRAYNPFGCIDCDCDVGGSVSGTCDKTNGQCVCKPRITGQLCDSPINTHYYPTLHQYQYELEEGHAPRGTRARFDYQEDIFPGYSWRGYVVLSDLQPEVQVDVDITKPSLYRLLYRFVNRNEDIVRGEVILTPEMASDVQQTSSVVFEPSRAPRFVTVSGARVVSTFVLNPGRWNIAVRSPENVFLDYLVLLPQAYYEATILQDKVARPCAVPGDPGPCLHYVYPPTTAYSSARGENGYIAVDQQRVRTQLLQQPDVLREYGVSAMGLLDRNQPSFYLDVTVPDPGEYMLVVDYYNQVRDLEQELQVEVASREGRSRGVLKLLQCQYSSPCRQVVTDSSGMPAKFNITSGYVSSTFTGDEEVNVAINSVTAIPYGDWDLAFLSPSVMCIRVQGQCVSSNYRNPVSSVRVDFESEESEDDLPPGILDTTTKLVKLDATLPTAEIDVSVRSPTQHVLMLHYYLSGSSGFDVDVIVEANGQTFNGIFRPMYCPSVSGCRGTVYFDTSMTDNILNLKDPNLRIIVNNTRGEELWLDYALVIPAPQYHQSLLDIQPVDRAGEFITNCAGEYFDIPSSAPRVCLDNIFTLTTDNNNGALPCECNIDGSLSFNCETYGGQCQCRPNVIGRDCSECKTGYYGFPRCQPCDCPFGLCHQVTGQCICPPRVTGDRCDVCMPETFGYDSLNGCEDCGCNFQGVVFGDLNCAQDTGQCNCVPNVDGRTCDTCVAGYHTFPRCEPCDCDTSGTTSAICDQDSAVCLCKENAEGTRCDGCKQDSFYLESRNPMACTKCFCFGVTTRCSSASLRRQQISDMRGWEITNTEGINLIEAGSTIAVPEVAEKIADTEEAMYWVAPDAYLGNKLTSYGGKLQFTVLFTIPRGETRGLIKPDIVLVGSNLTVVHYADEQPQASRPLDVEIDLVEYKFQHAFSGDIVKRDQFMAILVNLEALHIRASYYTVVNEVRLSNVRLDIASGSGQGDPAYNVEQCECPANYVGTSCEDCAPGYYRSRAGRYRGVCVACQCNGHAAECDSTTGECLQCRDNTMGRFCDQCLPGYYGDPATGPCTICSCPLPHVENNFAATCRADASGYTISCECLPGYSGPLCDACDLGYYGDPRVRGSRCEPCGCSGNLDLTAPGACDGLTGACLICGNNATGSQCERCQDWWYGDAVTRKDCRPCSCNQCGSESCDNSRGVCICKPNVIGPDCDRCPQYYYGFESCQGCRSCDCGVASASPQCDSRTGQCQCQPGVVGRNCERCQEGFWNYGPGGCQECQCLGDGALTCDSQTGRCQCLPGVTGDNCDRCLSRWVLIQGIGCRECDSCVHLLLDDMLVLERQLHDAERELSNITISYLAYRRLSQINQTVYELRVKIDLLLQQSSDIEVQPLLQRLLEYENRADRLQARVQRSLEESSVVEVDVQNTRLDALEVEQIIRDANSTARGAVQFIIDILINIQRNIQGTNIETYIRRARQILEIIEKKDFSAQNASAIVELQEALDALERARLMKQQADVVFNRTIVIHTDIGDVVDRLYDLQNNTRFSQEDSRDALDIVGRYIRPLKILEIVEKIRLFVRDSQGLVDMSRNLIDESNIALEDSQSAYEELDRESSRLDVAITQLERVVSVLRDQLDGVEPLVNESRIHADSLEAQSLVLSNIFVDIKVVSEKAVTAARAYTDIVEAIRAALAAAKQALTLAEDALKKSEGVGDDSRDSRERSRQLLLLAQKAFDDTSLALKLRLAAAVKRVEEVTDLNEKAELELVDVENEVKVLPTGFGTRAQDAAMKAMDAQRRAEEARLRVQGILNQLPEDRRKIQQIPNDIIDTNRMVARARGQVDSVLQMLPDAINLLGILAARKRRIQTLNTTVVANLTLLRERIALARDESNRIRLGVQFLGNTSIELRNPPNFEQAGSYSKLSLYLNTVVQNGLLLYIGSDQTPGQQKPKDYLSLELVNGKVVFRFDLGSGPALITNPMDVTTGEWFKIEAERIGKAGMLTVSREKNPNDVEKETVSGTSQGTFTVLELSRQATMFFVGGVPPIFNLPPGMIQQPFTGAVEELVFDGIFTGLWNFETGENNYVGAIERDTFRVLVRPDGFRFNGNGYAVVDRGIWRPNRRTDIIMQFKTLSADGLMLFMSKDRDFLSIEMIDGKVLFQFNLGSGRLKLMSEKTYNDDQWHALQASRRDRDGGLFIDSEEVAKGTSPGNLKELSISDEIYVGGYDQPLVPKDSQFKDVTSEGFDGCIQKVEFNQFVINLVEDNTRSKGVTEGCPDQVARVVSLSASNPGYVAYNLDEGIGTDFDITLKMRTVDANSLLLYTGNTDSSLGQEFSVAVIDGKVVVTVNAGEGASTVESDLDNYNDGYWHYVSIIKSGRKLMMNIDDKDTVEKRMAGIVDTITSDMPLYFGGIPSSLNVKSAAQFLAGCIGDVTIKGKFVNFAALPSAAIQRVSLTGCDLPIPKKGTSVQPDDTLPVLPTAVPLPPGQCRLPVVPVIKEGDAGSIEGTRFGISPQSREEYRRLPSNFKRRGSITFDFRTTAMNGLMFYLADKGHNDFVAVYILNGQVTFAFDCGSGPARLVSPDTYNDGQWHQVMLVRQRNRGSLHIDGNQVQSGRSKGDSTSINVSPPYFVGGLSQDAAKKAKGNVAITQGIIGCLGNFKLNGDDFGPAESSIGVQPCYEDVEIGTFLHADGGYVTLYDNYKVGLDLDIDLEIKPRTLSGIIMSVHSARGDFLALQLVDGELVVSVDNGGGIVTSRYLPIVNNELCDGQWHKVQVVKAKNVVTLIVDGVTTTPGIGAAGISATDTNDPLYIGGRPADASKRGILTDEQFVGCLRNLRLNLELQYLSAGVSTGRVQLDSCPKT